MYKLSAMHLVGLAESADVVVRWHPQGMLLELAQAKLAGLKEQYEVQLVALRKQLQQEKSSDSRTQPIGQTEENSDTVDSSRTVNVNQTDRASPRMANKGQVDPVIRQDVLTESSHSFKSQFTQLLSELGEDLTQNERETLEKLNPKLLAAHQTDLSTWSDQHQSELRLHVEAMRLTVSEDSRKQMDQMKAEFSDEKEAALTELQARLTDEYHSSLEQLQAELGELEASTGLSPDTSPPEIKAQHDAEITKLKQDYERKLLDSETNFVEELATLRSDYECQIQELRSHSAVLADKKKSQESSRTNARESPNSEVDSEASGPLTDPEESFKRVAHLSPFSFDSDPDTTGEHSQSMISELQEAIESYKAQIESLNDERRALEEKYDTELSEKMAALEEEHLVDLQDMEAKLTAIKDDHFHEIEDLQNRLGEYEEQLREVEASRDMDEYTTKLNTRTLEDEIERLTEELTEKDDEITELNKTISGNRSLDDELDKLTEQLTERDREIVKQRKKLAPLEKQVQELSKQLSERDQEITGLKEESDSYKETLDKLNLELTGKEETILKYQQRDKEYESMNEKVELLTKEVSRREEDVTKLKKRLAQTASLDEEIERLHDVLATREKELTDLKTSLGSSNGVNVKLEKDINDLKKVIVTRDSELNTLVEKHKLHVNQLTEDLGKQHQEKVEQLTKDLGKQHMEKVEQLTKDLGKQHQEKVEQLTKDLGKQHQEKVEQLTKDLGKQHQEKVEQLTKDLGKQHQEKVEQLTKDLGKQHQEKVEQLKQDLGKQHKEEVEQLTKDLGKQHQEKVEQLKHDLTDLQNQPMAGATATSEQILSSQDSESVSVDKQIDALKRTITELEKKNTETLNQIEILKDQHQQEMDEISSSLDAKRFEEVGNLKNQLTQKHDIEINTIRSQYLQLLQDKDDKTHERIEIEVNTVRAEMEQTIENELEAIRDSVKSEYEESAKEKEDEFEKFRLDIEKDFEEKLNDLQQKLEKEVEHSASLIQDLDTKSSQLRQEITDRMEKEFEQKLAEHDATVGQYLEKEYQSQLELLEQQNQELEEKLSQAKRETDIALEAQKKQHETTIQEQKLELELKIKDLEHELSRQKGDIRKPESSDSESLLDKVDLDASFGEGEILDLMEEQKQVKVPPLLLNLDEDSDTPLSARSEQEVTSTRDSDQQDSARNDFTYEASSEDEQSEENPALGATFDLSATDERIKKYEKKLEDQRYKMEELQTIVDNLEEQKQQQYDQLGDYEEKIDELEQQISTQQEKMQINDQKLKQYENRWKEQQRMRDSFDQERQDLFERIDEYEHKISNYDKDQKNYDTKWRDKVHKAENDKFKIEAQLVEAKDKLNEYKQKMDKAESDKAQLEAKLEDLQSKEVDYKNQLDKAKLEQEEMDKKLSEAKESAEQGDKDHEGHIADYETRIEQYEAKMKQMQSAHEDKLSDLMAQIEELENETKTQNQEEQDNDSSIKKYESEIRNKDVENQEKTRQISELEHEVIELKQWLERERTNKEKVSSLETRITELMSTYRTREEEDTRKISLYEELIEDLKQQLETAGAEETRLRHEREVEDIREQTRQAEAELTKLRQGIERGDAAEILQMKESLMLTHAEELTTQREQLEKQHEGVLAHLRNSLEQEYQTKLQTVLEQKQEEKNRFLAQQQQQQGHLVIEADEAGDHQVEPAENPEEVATMSSPPPEEGSTSESLTNEERERLEAVAATTVSSVITGAINTLQKEETDRVPDLEQNNNKALDVEDDGSYSDSFEPSEASSDAREVDEEDIIIHASEDEPDYSLDVTASAPPDKSMEDSKTQTKSLEKTQSPKKSSEGIISQTISSETSVKLQKVSDLSKNVPEITVTDESYSATTEVRGDSASSERRTEDDYQGLVNEASVMIQRHQNELEEIKSKHLEEIEDIRITVKYEVVTQVEHQGTRNEVVTNRTTELLNANLRKLEEMSSELERSHHSEIDEIRKHYEDQIHVLEARLATVEAEAKATLETQVALLKAQYEDRINAIKTDVQSTTQEELSAAALDTDNVVSDLESAHQKELADLSGKHQRELTELVDTHQVALTAQESKFKGKLLKLEQQLESLSTESSPEQDPVLSQEQQAGFDAQRTQLEAKTAQVDQLSTQLEQLRQQVSDYERLVGEYKTQVTDDKSNLDELQDLCHEYEAKIEDLEKRLEDESSGKDEDEINGLQVALESAKTEIENLKEQVEQTKTDLNAQKQAELKSQKEAYEDEIAKLCEALEASEVPALQPVPTESSGEAQDSNQRPPEDETDDNMASLAEQLNNRTSEYKKRISELESHMQEKKGEYELILERREREHMETGNLITMLRADIDKLSSERSSTQQANDHLLRLLSESVKVNLSVEDRISRRLASLIAEGGRGNSQDQPGRGTLESRESGVGGEPSPVASVPCVPGRPGGLSQDDADSTHNTSLASAFSDEGLELSQRISDSIFVGPDLDPDGEEVIIDTGNRLQTSVDRLLEIITDTTRQLHEAQQTQRDLVASMETTQEDRDELEQHTEVLQERLKGELEAKEYLASELNKAESLVRGYQSEHAEMEEAITSLEDSKESLVSELEHMRVRLQELEAAQDDMGARENDLLRQREALEQSIGQEQQAIVVMPSEPVTMATVPSDTVLLAENSRISEEKRGLEKQYSQDREALEVRLAELEDAHEDQRLEHERALEKLRDDNDDLLKQTEALDKQLKANRHFLEEQTLEREQEREDYQKQIDKLSGQLRELEKTHSAEKRLNREIQDLEEQLRERIDSHSQLSLRNDQLERDLRSQEATSHDLRDMIRTLEGDLEARTRGENALKVRLSEVEKELAKLQEANVDLDAERKRSDLDPEEMRRLLIDLESQVETLKKSEQLAWQKKKELEEELKNLRNLEDELTLAKEALQQQVYEQLQQISSLRVQVDEMKLGAIPAPSGGQLDESTDRDLSQLLESERQALEEKSLEILALTEQLDGFREQLLDRQDQVEQLAMQLEVSNRTQLQEDGDLKEQLESISQHNAQLETEVEVMRKQLASTPMPVFAQNLLDEKNTEIDDLNEENARLKQELLHIQITGGSTNNTEQLYQEIEEKNEDLAAKDAEIEELRLLVATMREAERLAREVAESQAEQEEDAEQALRLAQLHQGLDALKSLSEQEQLLLQTQVTRSEVTAGAPPGVRESTPVEVTEATPPREADPDPAASEVLQEKDHLIDQLSGQVDSLQNEIDNLTDFQAKLQEDYDTLQALMETRDKELEAVSAELEKVRGQGDGVTDIQLALEKELREKENIIEERAEELYTTNEQLEKQTEDNKQLTETKIHLEKILSEKDEEITRLQLHIQATGSHHGGSQASQGAGDATTELQARIDTQEDLINTLRGELEQARSDLDHTNSDLKTKQNDLNQAIKELQQLRQQQEVESAEHGQQVVEYERQVSRLRESLAVIEDQLSQVQNENSGQELQEKLLEQRNILSEQHQRHLQEIIKTTELDRILKLEEQESEHKLQLSDLESEHKQQLEQQLSDLESVHKLQLSQQESKHKLQLSDLESDYKQQLSDLESEHKQQLSDQSDFKQQLSDQKEQLLRAKLQSLAAQREQLEKEHVNAIEAERRQWQKRHTDEINRLILQQQAETHRARSAPDFSNDESLEWTRKASGPAPRSPKTEHPTTRSREDQGLDLSLDNSQLQSILAKVYEEGVGVLSLSEKSYLRGLGLGQTVGLDVAWAEERQSLLAAIRSLRDLLSETHKTRDTSKVELAGYDWRSDLLRAVHGVFAQENSALLSELNTYKIINGQTVLPSVERLENIIQQQESSQRVALQQLLAADRQSLLAEIQTVQREISRLRSTQSESTGALNEQLRQTEEESTKRERHLKRQIELLEYKIQQERVISEDLRASLEAEKSRTTELHSQLSRERISNTELTTEISDTQTQLQKLKDALDREQQRLMSASGALEDERNKVNSLNESLVKEQKMSESYIEELENEKLRGVKLKDRTGHVIELFEKERQGLMLEKLKHDLENEKERRLDAINRLEREQLSISALRRDLDLQREHSHTVEGKLQTKVTELRTSLDMERARCNELNSALQRERHLVSQLRDTLTDERSSISNSELRDKVTVAELQAMLDLERSRVLDLQSTSERGRVKETTLLDLVEQEQKRHEEHLEQERAANRQLKHTIDTLQNEKSELAQELQYAGEKVTTLQSDRDRLYASLQTTKDRLKDSQTPSSPKHKQSVGEEVERARRAKQDTELHTLRGRLADLELQLAEARRHEIQVREERDLERLKHAMSPLTLTRGQHRGRESPGKSASSTPTKHYVNVYRKQLEQLRQKLQLLGIRQQEELARCVSSGNSRLSLENNSELNSISSALKDILEELQELHVSLDSSSTDDDQSRISRSVPAINERILRQNSDLTSYVSRLSEEKRELQATIGQLEDDVHRYQQREGAFIETEHSEGQLQTERGVWTEQKAVLTLRINDLEKEINRLKDMLRRTEIELEREREKYLQPRESILEKSDKDKMQRLYGKYIRAESFRKALIYQKKYLLTLLGGFQDCEEQTLATIARLGAYPSPQSLEKRLNHSRPFTRFRSAVRVVIAISRLRFLVTKWRRSTRVGAPAIAGSQQENHGLVNTVTVTMRSASQSLTNGHASNSTHHAYKYKPANHMASSQAASSSHQHLSQSEPGNRRTSANHHSRRQTEDPRSESPRVNGFLGNTPPTRDLGNLDRYRSNQDDIEARIQAHIRSQPKKELFSALDPLPQPTATPPPSLSGCDTPISTDVDADDALNDYIQRLENLQARLVNHSSKTHPR